MKLRLSICLFLTVLVGHAQNGRGGMPVPRPASGQPAPPATDCAASGTVVNSITGGPIPRAMVTLGGGDGSGSSTDDQGRWSISNTLCVSRMANATRIGFVSSNNFQSASASRPAVQLVSGSPVSNVRISLTPEAIISGKVQDANGDPLEAVQINIMRVMIQNGKRVLNNAGGTPADSQGNFRIGGLLPGRYIVCADSRQITYPLGGGPGMVYRGDCYPGSPAAGVSIAMPVEAGREVRTAFTLTPIQGAHVRGSVSGAPGSAPGSPRVAVQLMQAQNGRGGPNSSAQVMPDGTFDISGALPGSYLARAILQAMQPNGAIATAQAAVEVGDSDVNGLTLALQPAGSLSGTVRFESSNPASNPTTTIAMPMINVNLSPAMPGIGSPGPIPQAQWDAGHLNFVFANVPAGQFQIRANLNGPNRSGVYIKSATLRGQDVLNQPITVDGSAGPIDVVVSDDAGGVDVTVNDANGQPVAASVILAPAGGPPVFLNSGDDGHATRTNVPTGNYRAWAFDDISTVPYAEKDWMAQTAGPGEKVTVASVGTATVTLKRIVAPPE